MKKDGMIRMYEETITTLNEKIGILERLKEKY